MDFKMGFDLSYTDPGVKRRCLALSALVFSKIARNRKTIGELLHAVEGGIL